MVDEYPIKICVIGSTDLKTKMVRRFAEGKFTINRMPTLGVDITTKRIEVQNNIIKLIMVDTAGQKFFGKIRPSYYRGASSCLIVFDKSDRKSFKAVNGWLKNFREHVTYHEVPIGLVGIITKSEEVTTEEGKSVADKLGMSYYETTVSERGSISAIFRDLTIKALESKE